MTNRASWSEGRYETRRFVFRLLGWLFAVLFVATGCGGVAPTPSTPTTEKVVSGAFGVLVMAHGGTPEWNEAVLRTVEPLREKYAIEVAFGMADATTLQDAVRKLEARDVRRIGVVRLFVSGESWTNETEQIFGLRPGAPPAPSTDAATHEGPHVGHASHASPGPHAAHVTDGGQGAPAHGDVAAHGMHGGHSMAFFRVTTRSTFALSTEGLADAPKMGEVLADRVAAISKSPAREDVLILAHGPGDDGENERWLAKLDARASSVRTRVPFRRVQVETLREDWPEKRVEAEKRIRAFVTRAAAEGGKAVVVPFRVQGFGPYRTVLEGLDYASDGTGLIPHVEVTRWIARQIGALERGPFRAPL